MTNAQIDLTEKPAVTFEDYAADRLGSSAAELAAAWVADVPEFGSGFGDIGERQVGLRAVTQLLRAVAHFVHDESSAALDRNPAVAEALETVARTLDVQRRSPAAILRDMDRLARVLETACCDWVRSFPNGSPPPSSVARVVSRLHRAPVLIAELALGEHDGNGVVLPPARQFVQMLRRELIPPLNAAAITAQLLESAPGPIHFVESRRLAALIRRNLMRADAIMRELQGEALPIPGGEELTASRLPFGLVIGEVLREVHDELVGEGVLLDVEEPIADLIVDAERVKVILVNLIRNAIRYSNPNRPDRWICVRCTPDGARDLWWIHVSDNGLGVPAEHHGSMFQRFSREHAECITDTALRLIIVREVVAQLGGEIEFENEPGRGTTFRFSLTQSGAGRNRTPAQPC